MNNLRENFGEWFRSQEAFYNLNKLSRDTGYSRNNLENYKSGTIPSLLSFIELCVAMKINPSKALNEIIHWDNSKHKNNVIMGKCSHDHIILGDGHGPETTE